ncbi:class I SAM-dependent methyltransferase [Streptomyces virginiae]|uniref:class I SAM-dependent methyltransferase n=1 Tax=Streptomyces TaxID=1883 RepID=UPI001CFC7FAE|nr:MULTISPECIES: class I SAM-dependent methyltransferase [Streptomyces]MCB5163573.1 class I SAM-dependent methyltransferase [Streptomyces bambusae]MDX6758727.1 class I SAM-dependent methyltransferase [Streptomyces sp. F8]
MKSIDARIADFYAEYDEASRLHATAVGRLEFERTRELLRRHLPVAPARVLDVGGGPGTHARWLTKDGYEVLLVDPVPKHVEQARAYAPGCSAELGDARDLAFPSDCFEAVLLLGPLYHLADRADRLRALREACRVTVPGGLVAAAGISRYSLMQDYTVSAGLTPELLAGEVAQVISTGSYDGSRGFTVIHFHTAAELAEEATEAGLNGVSVHGIEGPGWAYVVAADRYASQKVAGALLADAITTARLADEHCALVDASSHVLAVGTV